MNRKEYTYFEWNIKGAGGHNDYATPPFVVETILEHKTDIVVLTEFYIGITINDLITSLGKEYYIYISPFVKGYNQILIGLKKDTFRESQIVEVGTINPIDMSLPEYLSVKLKIEEKNLHVIGLRVKTQRDTFRQQINFLNAQLNQMANAICIGDFNATASNLSPLFSEDVNTNGPRTLDNENWSFVHANDNKVGIDLVVSKGICINRSKDRDNQYAEYKWDFMKKGNGYDQNSTEYIKSFDGKPNHAILIGSFCFRDVGEE